MLYHLFGCAETCTKASLGFNVVLVDIESVLQTQLGGEFGWGGTSVK